MGIKGQLAHLPHSDLRKAPRRIVNLAASLREQGATSTEVEVLDLSTTGFRVQTQLGLAPGSYVWLKLPGQEAMSTRVVWAEGDIAGCEFVTPLHHASVEQLLVNTRAKPAPRWRFANGRPVFGNNG
jgi:hypothetical protein